MDLLVVQNCLDIYRKLKSKSQLIDCLDFIALAILGQVHCSIQFPMQTKFKQSKVFNQIKLDI